MNSANFPTSSGATWHPGARAAAASGCSLSLFSLFSFRGNAHLVHTLSTPVSMPFSHHRNTTGGIPSTLPYWPLAICVPWIADMGFADWLTAVSQWLMVHKKLTRFWWTRDSSWQLVRSIWLLNGSWRHVRCVCIGMKR